MHVIGRKKKRVRGKKMERAHHVAQGFLRDLIDSSTWHDDRYRGCSECNISERSSTEKLSAVDEKTLRKAQKLLERLGEDTNACKRALLKHSR